ncbi:alpha/beta hydrolase [Nocardia sp. NPDC058518]|uniref:alpha/beta hydrolase n=1 Tax=Nocardia sp. NPDC058518 TaxID=3346534 RepID=UPI003649E2CC
MSNDVVLIHGTWCNGSNWGEFATELEKLGYTVHTPTLRFHGAPGAVDVWANAQRVGEAGLGDYVDDLAELVESLEAPPIVIGHSVGALLAQLLAARVRTAGVVLLGPAPTAGMWNAYPSMFRIWARYLPQWLAGRPMYPVSWKVWTTLICNTTAPEIQRSYYATLCAESGTAYRQMSLWFLDPGRNARVDFTAVDAPVLVIAGSQDRCTVPRIGKITAAKYRTRGSYVVLEGSDHMMTVGKYLPITVSEIGAWADQNGLLPNQPVV